MKSRFPVIFSYKFIDNEFIIPDNGDIASIKNPKTKLEVSDVAVLKEVIIDLLKAIKEIFKRNDFKKILQYDDIDNTHNLLVNQLIFDILHDAYIQNSPMLTLTDYCNDYINYNWLNYENDFKVTDQERNSNIDSTRKWMNNQIKLEATLDVTDFLKSETLTSMGLNVNRFSEYIKTHNKPFEKTLKKPKYIWDRIYYNGNPYLITSKQYKRVLPLQKQSNNNYTINAIQELLRLYDLHIGVVYNSSKDDSASYIKKSFDYYNLEIYKRVDFMYKLSKLMENEDIKKMDKDNLLIKRFTPIVIYPYLRNGSILFRESIVYYRPLLFVEEFWQQNKQFDGINFNFTWFYYHLLRAKTFELFLYHFKFNICNYNEMSDFLNESYNILGYFDSNKKWIYEDKGKKSQREILIKNWLNINDLLFNNHLNRKKSN
jgi:hypothetical protein